jgi:hypothetical protein
MSQIFNTVQPEALKDSYGEFDTVDFVLTFENQSLVLNSLKLEGTVELSDPVNSYVDFNTGIHGIIDTIAVDTQNQGNRENLTEYGNYVKMYSETNLAPEDFYNSAFISELRSGGIDYCKGMFKANPKPDFCFKPLICLNQSVGQNNLLDFSKTGAITIRMRLNRNVNFLFGDANDATKTYTVTNLKLSYNTVNEKSPEPVQMKTYVQLKQNLTSQLANVNTKVPAVCYSVACSFLPKSKANLPQFNQYQTYNLPGLQEVVFMFNDSTNTYITYPLRTQEEVIQHYIRSLNETGHNLIKSQNSLKGFGIGLNFEGMVDLRNQKFNVQIRSGIVEDYIMRMYFLSLIQM